MRYYKLLKVFPILIFLYGCGGVIVSSPDRCQPSQHQKIFVVVDSVISGWFNKVATTDSGWRYERELEPVVLHLTLHRREAGYGREWSLSMQNITMNGSYSRPEELHHDDITVHCPDQLPACACQSVTLQGLHYDFQGRYDMDTPPPTAAREERDVLPPEDGGDRWTVATWTLKGDLSPGSHGVGHSDPEPFVWMQESNNRQEASIAANLPPSLREQLPREQLPREQLLREQLPREQSPQHWGYRSEWYPRWGNSPDYDLRNKQRTLRPPTLPPTIDRPGYIQFDLNSPSHFDEQSFELGSRRRSSKEESLSQNTLKNLEELIKTVSDQKNKHDEVRAPNKTQARRQGLSKTRAGSQIFDPNSAYISPTTSLKGEGVRGDSSEDSSLPVSSPPNAAKEHHLPSERETSSGGRRSVQLRWDEKLATMVLVNGEDLVAISDESGAPCVDTSFGYWWQLSFELPPADDQRQHSQQDWRGTLSSEQGRPRHPRDDVLYVAEDQHHYEDFTDFNATGEKDAGAILKKKWVNITCVRRKDQAVGNTQTKYTQHMGQRTAGSK